MPTVNAATGASLSSTVAPSFEGEADALVAQASHQTGTLDPHLLAQAVARLTPT